MIDFAIMPAPSKISVVTDRGHEIRVTILPEPEPQGAMAMLGFAKRFRKARRTQAWMAELREGKS